VLSSGSVVHVADTTDQVVDRVGQDVEVASKGLLDGDALNVIVDVRKPRVNVWSHEGGW